MKHKYPIGTKIKYRGCAIEDVGKKGTIVGYTATSVWIVVPNSYLALAVYGDSGHKWSTNMASLEILVHKNEQLLFDFMHETL